jgi:hypothetical protein
MATVLSPLQFDDDEIGLAINSEQVDVNRPGFAGGSNS